MTEADGTMAVHFENEQGSIDVAPPATQVAERVRLEEPIFADDLAFLQEAAAGTGRRRR